MGTAAARAPAASRRLAVLLVALAAAAAGALVAPAAWPAGEATLALAWRGTPVTTTRAALDAGLEVVLAGPVADRQIEARLPRGLSSKAPTQAWLAVLGPGGRERPGLGDVRLTAVLADGREVLVAPLRWDEARQALLAERRPPRSAGVVLGLLGLVVVLWITESVPLWVTALLVPVVLVGARVGSPKDALAPFFHPVIALFFGGFLLAEALHRCALDRRAALTIVARAGRSPAGLFAALLAASAFLSLWISNTAAAAVLLPIALAVTAPLQSEGYRKVVVLGVAYAATLGGTGSAIGTPANPLAIAFLDTFVGRRLAFVDWFAVGLPLVLLFLPVLGWFLWWREGVRIDPQAFAVARRRAQEERRALGPLTREQAVVLAVFVAVMAVWLTEALHEIDPGIVALAGAVALAMLGRIQSEDLGRISWAALLTFGGGLTLGTFLTESGTGDWLATRLGPLAGLPPFVSVAGVAALSLALTAVASNTATAAMLIPLAIPLAGVMGVDPTLLVLVVALASSIDFALVIGTPPTMIAYSTGLFTAREIFRRGILLDLLGLGILVTAVVGVWHLVGVL